MPVINLARLKLQVAKLAENFSNPEAFVNDLRELLDLYTNRTIRSTQIAQRLSIPTYRTPQPILRQIETELQPLAEARPLEAVLLTHELWKNYFLETRLLASRLLGMIPPSSSLPILIQLPDWLEQTIDKALQNSLLTDSFYRIRHDDPETFIILMEEWLKSPSQKIQAWGLWALVPLLQESNFNNLPKIFHVLIPTIEHASPPTQIEIQGCLVALGNISITETLYFLREMINNSPNPMMLRTLRRILPKLPFEIQKELSEVIKQKEQPH